MKGDDPHSRTQPSSGEPWRTWRALDHRTSPLAQCAPPITHNFERSLFEPAEARAARFSCDGPSNGRVSR